MFANKFGGYEQVECGLVHVSNTRDSSKPVCVPLKSVNVLASIVHCVAQVEVTQIFVNNEDQPIEAIYYFPVDSNGAVTHFEAELEGRNIKGIVKTVEEAQKQYKKAVKEQKTAFLGQENKPDIFKVRVGFLKPGSQAKIILGYTTEVKNEKGSSNSLRFFIPTTVAPRYIPQRCTDEKTLDLANMEFSENSPVPMSIKVNVSFQGKLKTVESPTHGRHLIVTHQGPVPEKPSWSKAVVDLICKTTDMDRDFVLLVTPVESHKPRLYFEKLDSSLVTMAHLIPSFELDEQKTELIFVLDRSGSMGGKSIALAKKALIFFLHSLPVDCYFNIVGFGSSYKLLFPNSVRYDDVTLKTAISHAKGLRADMGGTEILQPLKEIFGSPQIPGYSRQIFVLTDGEVENTEEVIGLIKACDGNRVFSLGIGDSASHHLVEGLAFAGNGTSAFVTYNEPIETKVLLQLKNAMQPSLTDVNISWHGLPPTPSSLKSFPSTKIDDRSKIVTKNKIKTLLGYGKPMVEVKEEGQNVKDDKAETEQEQEFRYRQVPEHFHPIFDGSQLLVFGIFEGFISNSGTWQPSGLTITAQSPDGPLSIEMELNEDNDVGGTGMLHKLAGIKAVREMEVKILAMTYQTLTRHHILGQKTEESLKSEIIKTSLAQGFASKYTSFIAIDSSSNKKVPDNWMMQTRMVPSQFAHGWHGADEDRMIRRPTNNVSRPYVSSTFSIVMDAVMPTSNFRSARTLHDSTFRNTTTSTDSYNCNDPLKHLISFQSFDGSFKLSDEFIRALTLDVKLVKQEVENRTWDTTGWATALALTYFSEKCSDKQDTWGLVATKANKWLTKNSPSVMEAMLQTAKSLFSTIKIII